MRAIAENTVIQIEISNACVYECQGCTRHVGHHRKPFFMSLDEIANAIKCTVDSPCRIGLMGGEPTMHPKFRDILALYRELIPDKRRREFWTAGFKWRDYKDEVHETFDKDLIHYNDHVAYDGMHKPLLVAIDEVVDDPVLRAELIDNCPYQTHWSASITPKGAFPCEIAASMDWLFDGPGGWPVEKDWWKRGPDEYGWMIDRYCQKCSGAIPMPARSDGRGGRDGPTVDLVTPQNAERLLQAGSRKAQGGHLEIFKGKITREDIERHKSLNPRAYRSFVAHNPEDVAKNT